MVDNSLSQKVNKEPILIDKEKLTFIIESMDNKFRLINEYYGKKEFTQKTDYINEIEISLTLTLFEELMILKIFNRKKNEPFTSKQEISFIQLKKTKKLFQIELT